MKKRVKFDQNLRELDDFIEKLKPIYTGRIEWKSPIHMRLTVNGDWTDFWPTTGTWMHLASRTKDKGVASLSKFILDLLERPHKLINIPPPPVRKTKPTPPLANSFLDDTLDMPSDDCVDTNPDTPPWT